MRRLAFLILSTVLLAALIPPASAFAQTATPTPTPTSTSTPTSTPTTTPTPPPGLTPALWVPIAVRGVSGDNSGIQVQNNSSSSATLVLDYYDQAGALVATGTQRTAASGESATFFQGPGDEPTLPFGFDGSAVVRSTTPQIAAIVNRVNYTGPLASTGSLTVPNAPSANAFTVPLVYGGLNGYVTTLSVQNTGTAAATYSVSLQANVGTTASPASTSWTIPANAVRRLRVGNELPAPAGFIGTATIGSTAGTLVAVGETKNTGNNISLSSGGVATGSTTMNAPLLFKNYDANVWVSGAQVANTTSGTITVNGSVKARDDNTTYSLPTVTLGPNQGHFYDLLTTGDLPDNFVGSGVFTASGPIALTVQETSAPRQTGMGYNGFPAGTTRISVPLIFKASGQLNAWNTGVQVQNLGAVPTTVVITYRSPVGGLLASESQVAQPGDSVTFFQPANPSLPDGLTGSATVTSDGQPIVAIVNEVNYALGGDAAMAYEGINI